MQTVPRDVPEIVERVARGGAEHSWGFTPKGLASMLRDRAQRLADTFTPRSEFDSCDYEIAQLVKAAEFLEAMP